MEYNPAGQGIEPVKNGVIEWGGVDWFDIDLTGIADLSKLNGRYIQLRMLSDTKNKDSNDWTQPGVPELRIGVNE